MRKNRLCGLNVTRLKNGMVFAMGIKRSGANIIYTLTLVRSTIMLQRRIFFLLLIIPLLVLLQTRAYSQSLNDKQLVDSLVRVADSLKMATATPDSTIHALDSAVAMTDSSKIAPDTSAVPIATKPSGSGGYKINGAVKDRNTGEGVPFANIFFPGTNTGTVADIDGNFSLAFDKIPGDSVRVSALGYGYYGRKFDRSRHDANYYIELTREVNEMAEFVFHAGEDPALALLKKIIAHKPQNNPDRLENYKYEVYNKLEVDLQHLTKKQFEHLPVPMIKKFSFIYKNLDSTTEKTPFLPFFLTETLSDYYFQRTPKKTKEFIRASQVKGVKNESVDQFLGAMYQNLNAYDNFIPVFDKSFVSPISVNGAFYYKYKIRDTQMAYGHPIILVQFTPKRNGENCFFGDFWVADSSFALQRISMEVPKDANINWVTRVSLYQEYAPVTDTFWFPVKDKFTADFVAPYNMKLPGFVGRKTTSYRDVVANDSSVSRVVNDKKLKEDVMVADTARNVSEAYWIAARHDTLNKNERAIYTMMDTLNAMPAFMRFKKIMKFAIAGTIEYGPLEIGPYYYLYSSNPIEGQRFRLGLGTTPKMFKNIYLSGYGAYGLKDEQFKYYASGLWLLQRHPRMYIFASYKHDIERTDSYYDNQIGADNIFGTLFRKSNVPWKLAFADDARFEFYKQYFSGFSHMLTFQHRSFSPYAPLPAAGIFKDQDGNSVDQVVSTEAGIRLRYAYKEKFLEGNYYRVSLGSDYPIVEARFSAGFKNLLASNYEYQKASLSISDVVKIAPLGSLYYNVFGGKTFGTLPYPLLDIAPGNEFHYYNRYAFNMMNRYEFISDQYVGFNIEHNIGGGIFNYIPYLKKAKLRQFWTAKGIIGSLSDENHKLNFDKNYPFRTLEGSPYIEVGTGIENIFQVFRIDFVWRVTPKPLPDETKEHYFGVFGSVRFGF